MAGDRDLNKAILDLKKKKKMKNYLSDLCDTFFLALKSCLGGYMLKVIGSFLDRLDANK